MHLTHPEWSNSVAILQLLLLSILIVIVGIGSTQGGDQTSGTATVPIDQDARFIAANYLQLPDSENPSSIEEFNAIVHKAMEKLRKEKTIMTHILKGIETALKVRPPFRSPRSISYIRLIGAGSLRLHMDHYKYQNGERNRANFNAYSAEKRHDHAKKEQIRAIFQLALLLLIRQHFSDAQPNQPIKRISVEDMHLEDDSLEVHYLKQLNLLPIRADPANKFANLEQVPEQMQGAPADVTLVIMFKCPMDMTWQVIQAYDQEKQKAAGPLILMETSLANPAYTGLIYESFRAECYKKLHHKLTMLDISEEHDQQMANDLFNKNTHIYY